MIERLMVGGWRLRVVERGGGVALGWMKRRRGNAREQSRLPHPLWFGRPTGRSYGTIGRSRFPDTTHR